MHIEMPGMGSHNDGLIVEAVKNGTLDAWKEKDKKDHWWKGDNDEEDEDQDDKEKDKEPYYHINDYCDPYLGRASPPIPDFDSDEEEPKSKINVLQG